MGNLNKKQIDKIVDRLLELNSEGQKMDSLDQLDCILEGTFSKSQRERIWHRYCYRKQSV